MLKRPIPDEARFRNQCTGIGQTRMASERTGAHRSQCVIDCAPKDQRKFGKAAGYPPAYEDSCYTGHGLVRQARTLR